MKNLKIFGQTLAAIGVILLLIDNLTAPDVMVYESSPSQPPYLSWVIWAITALGTIVYIVADHLPARKSKVPIQTEQQHHRTNEQEGIG